MDWVKSFYAKQHQWANVYSGDVEDWHRDKAKSIELPNRPPPYRILELGCGGGQMAAALAELSHTVVGIDMNPDAILNARRLAGALPDSEISLIEGDFFAFSPELRFDVVCCFDGFGIGADDDQQRLLQRIASWLVKDGRAFIEIYTPWYWERTAGREMQWPDASRRYGFDEDGCRMLDTWWPAGHPAQAVTQSLRCYSPDDLESLLDGTELELVAVRSGGAVDPETGVFRPEVLLEEAMQYVAVLSHQRQEVFLELTGRPSSL